MKLYALQILRAFAAISVLITHVFQKSDYKPFGEYYLSGQYGVDVFFILSGFLIYITTKNQTNHWGYLKKRVFRIYPLYLFALVFYILFEVNHSNLNITVKNLIQNILMLPWDSKWTYQSLIVGVAWSTLFEMFFYILFFFLIFFKFKRKVIFVLIPLLFLIFFPLNILVIPSDVPFLSLFVSLAGSLHLIMFLTGCFIGELYVSNKLPKIKKQIYLIYLFLTIGFMGVILLSKYNFFLSFIACISLFLAVLQFERYYMLRMDNFLVKAGIHLGDISYSIYIFHILIIGVLINIFEVKTISMLLLLTLILTIFISTYTYRFVEKKFIELGKK